MAESPTARINKLEQAVAALQEQHGGLKQRIDRDDVPSLIARVAVVESQIKDLREGRQEWARRAWAIVGPILGAVIGAVLTYIFKR